MIDSTLDRKITLKKDLSRVKAQIYPIVEVIIQTQKVVFVSWIMLVNILQELDLIKALIEKIFVIFYNFNTYIHSCVQIMCLDGFAECS